MWHRHECHHTAEARAVETEGQKKAGFWLATNNGDPFSDFQGDEHWVY
jgi:hypothetical protein